MGTNGTEGVWLDELPLQRIVEGRAFSEPLRAPLAFSAVGVRAPAEAEVWVRTATEPDGEWTEWRTVLRAIDEAPDPDADERTDVVPRATRWVGEAHSLQVAVADATLDDVMVRLIDSVGLDPLSSAIGALGLGASTVAASPAGAAHAAVRPPIITRPEWGAARGGSPRYAGSVRFAVVHHTVTGNGYSRSDAPAIVRSIQHYHMHGNGWKDIGYNFLVDRHGQIFEGRRGGMDRPVIGAHAAGFNSGATGIALIGDHRSSGVTEPALGALTDLLVWLFGLHGINPYGTTVERSGGSTRYPRGQQARLDCLSGHRDASRTSCPGNASYAVLGSLREAVSARLNDATEAAPDIPPLPRLGGKDGVATAILVSTTAFGDGEADRAVIANDRVFADAAAAGPLAGAGGPVLLNRPDELDERVHAEIERVLPEGKTVFLLGGPAALSPLLETELGGRWVVHRLAGWDRASTAAMVAERVVALRGNRTALVTRAGPDDAWSDALAAGAYGARHGTPLLLTDSDRLSPATRAAITALRIERTIVIGGPRAVSDEVMAELPNPRRVAGSSRDGTAVAVARELWGVVGGVIVAGGYRRTAWKDPLAAAPLAARRQAPVVLVDTDTLPSASAGYLRERGELGLDVDHGLVVGGRAAVSDAVARRCAEHLAR